MKPAPTNLLMKYKQKKNKVNFFLLRLIQFFFESRDTI
jgi:hypothetical protein